MNSVLITSCTNCNHVMFRNGFRVVECWITRAYATKQHIMNFEGKRRPKEVPIPDWCPLGVIPLETITQPEYAMFDGKLRRVEKQESK